MSTIKMKQQLLKSLRTQRNEVATTLKTLNDKINEIKNSIKNECEHNEIIHYILPGYDRAEHEYTCKCCQKSFNFGNVDFNNIIKTIEY